jgi:hypothetical protein
MIENKGGVGVLNEADSGAKQVNFGLLKDGWMEGSYCESSGLKTLFEQGQKFDVDLRHLMEGIAQMYSFDIWKTLIVENVDNFIDEKDYHTIMFSTETKGILKIEMIGTGMAPEVFSNLSKIALTTKIDEFMRTKKEGLGYYGWGLKATLWAARTIEIETKLKGYRGRQVWYWGEDGNPRYKWERPTLSLAEDGTVFIYHLKDEYVDAINERSVIDTLQEFYPTLLAGAPALRRKRKFIVNGKEVPKPTWLNEENYEKVEYCNLKVEGESLGGCVFISKTDLEEELRGIAVIVCGRKITRLDPFPEVKKYTGYVHADVFFKDLTSDKTQLRKANNPRFQEFKRQLMLRLEGILREGGLLPRVTIEDKEFIRKIHRVMAEIFRELPELEKLGIAGPITGRARVYMKGDEVSVKKEIGPSSKTDITSKRTGKGIDQPGWGEEGPTISPSESGKERAREEIRKRRGLPQFLIEDLGDDQIEASYEGGRVIVNNRHPIYQYVKRAETARLYHACRAGLEAILDKLLSEQEIDMKKYSELKRRIVFTLGSVL